MISTARLTASAIFLATIVVPALAGQTVSDRLLANHRWYLPSTDEKLPTVVAIPGCSGVSLDSPQTDQGRPGHVDDVLFRLHYSSMAERLHDSGFAVLLIDLLSAEGVVNACSGEIAAATIAQYINAAIDLAGSQAYVDASRIFVLGWSMGGGGLIAWLSDADIAQTGVRGAIAVYPSCGGRKPIEAEIPLLMLLGSADDIAEPEECEDLVARSPSRPLITVKAYEGARHGFDIEDAPEVLDIGNGMTVGYQKDAAEAAWQETVAFLESNQPGETGKRQ